MYGVGVGDNQGACSSFVLRPSSFPLPRPFTATYLYLFEIVLNHPERLGIWMQLSMQNPEFETLRGLFL